MLKERTRWIAEYAKDGLTAKQIGSDLEMKPRAVRSIARRSGIEVKKEVDCDYRDHVADMKPVDAVEYLLDVLETLAPSLQKSEKYRFNFTYTENVLFDLLEANAGRFVSRSKIMDRLYCTYAADDVPQEKVITVFVHKIRSKIAGSGLSIESRHFLGYQLIDDSKPDVT